MLKGPKMAKIILKKEEKKKKKLTIPDIKT